MQLKADCVTACWRVVCAAFHPMPGSRPVMGCPFILAAAVPRTAAHSLPRTSNPVPQAKPARGAGPLLFPADELNQIPLREHRRLSFFSRLTSIFYRLKYQFGRVFITLNIVDGGDGSLNVVADSCKTTFTHVLAHIVRLTMEEHIKSLIVHVGRSATVITNPRLAQLDAHLGILFSKAA